MPPRRAATGRGRGGGSGRGRGGPIVSMAYVEVKNQFLQAIADNVSVEDAENITMPPVIKVEPDDEPSASNSPLPQASDDTVEIKPNVFADLASDTPPDPNASPASQPTETPAPTPMRPPPQVTQPVVPRIVGEKVKKESRFKPRNIRGDQKKLAELAEQAKIKKENEERAVNGRLTRGMGHRGLTHRGRGDAMGSRPRDTASASANGIWGIAPASEQGQSAPGGSKHLSLGGSGSSGGGSGGGGSGGSSGTASQSNPVFRTHKSGNSGKSFSGRGAADLLFEPEYPDEDDKSRRIDIATINDDDSEDDVVVTGSRTVSRGKGRGLQQSKGGLKPVRLDRHEHKDRVTINNDDEIIKSEPKAKASKDEQDDDTQDNVLRTMPSSTNLETGNAPSTSDVKRTPATASASATNTPAPITFGEASADDAMQVDEEFHLNVPPSPESKKKPLKTSNHEKMPSFQTVEDKAEYERTQRDADIIREEMLKMYSPARIQDSSEDVVMEDSNKDTTTGRTYLFQIPPRVPTLFDPKGVGIPDPKAKVEEDNEILLTGTKTGEKEPIDLSKEKKKVKFTEEKVTVIKEEDGAEKTSVKSIKDSYVHEQGYVGRLVVRKSGRMEMVWGNGGPPMVVKSGIRTSFLSVSAVVQHPEVTDSEATEATDATAEQGGLGGASKAAATKVRGVASGMGEIMGKFVVTPDFEKLLA